MAIAQTGAIYKALNFDGKSSRTYGVYITGEAVYNAPERAVEMISIPGRNGAFALDQGRFENITVTYPAGIFADNEVDFAEAISDFRNYLCSRSGYCRLTDDYNPDEYRLAVYKSGLEVSPALLRAGQFEITFECKPQRFLTSGETAVAVASGGTLTNPTLFEASPLLAAKGYGAINVNGYEIKIINETVGDISITGGTFDALKTINFGNVPIQAGDTIDVYDIKFVSTRTFPTMITSASVLNWSGDTSTAPTVSIDSATQKSITVIHTFSSPISFTYGTAADKIVTANISVNLEQYQSYIARVSYDGINRIRLNQVYVNTTSNRLATMVQFSSAVVHSTKPAYGNPTYIDCDLGEAYEISGGGIISLNRFIELGSELPKLASGSNTITYDNTITELKVTPRWWKV